MWYFLIKQSTLDTAQYRTLQKAASLTEVELFNEPYENWYVFAVERERHHAFVDQLDREGIAYELTPDHPNRDDLLAAMR